MRCILVALNVKCEGGKWYANRAVCINTFGWHDEEHFPGHRTLTCLHKPLTESDKLQWAGWERIRVLGHLQCHWTRQRDQHRPLFVTHSHGEDEMSGTLHTHGTEDGSDAQALVPASSDNASNIPVTAQGRVSSAAGFSGLQQLPLATSGMQAHGHMEISCPGPIFMGLLGSTLDLTWTWRNNKPNLHMVMELMKYGIHFYSLKLLSSDLSTVTVFFIICFSRVMQFYSVYAAYPLKTLLIGMMRSQTDMSFWQMGPRKKKNMVFILDPHLGPLPNIRISQMGASHNQEQLNPLTALYSYGRLGTLCPRCLAMCLAKKMVLFHVIIGFRHDVPYIVRSESLRSQLDMSVHCQCTSCSNYCRGPFVPPISHCMVNP